MVDQIESFPDLFELGGVKSQIPDIVVQGPVEIRQKIFDLGEFIRKPVQLRIDPKRRSKEKILEGIVEKE